MTLTLPHAIRRAIALSGVLLLSACVEPGTAPEPSDETTTQASQALRGFEVKLLLGSALAEFCDRATERFNQQNPTLENGDPFHITCETKGSGDVVSTVLTLAKQLQQGNLSPDAPEFPTLLSVDGEIYHSQLIYQMNSLFQGKNYIPQLTDAPLLANSPMVFMTQADLANGLQQSGDPFQILANNQSHEELDPNAPPIPIHYVHTAPTRSNSGLQTLVTQFAAVSGKRPENLTLADVQQYQGQVQKIQQKVTRYGASTGSLAEAMVENGPYWASVGSVYESSVIEANLERDPNQNQFVAVYPEATFTSNMRAILPNAPWVDAREREAAQQVIEFFRTSEIQQIATEFGLRPGIPGVDLGNKFSAEFGVTPDPKYDSYRPPQPEVVEAMIDSWQQYAKKPSQVAVVIDTSGSMSGRKIAAVQNTLRNYIQNLGPKEQIALISFSSEINEPVLVKGDEEGRKQGMEFIGNLRVKGDTRLYDAALYARNWLQDNLRSQAINAVLILTDGQDSGSKIALNQLKQELKKSGFSSDQRIAFFTVGYGQEGEFDANVLETIAELNGGYYRKGDPETISELMADLQVEF